MMYAVGNGLTIVAQLLICYGDMCTTEVLTYIFLSEIRLGWLASYVGRSVAYKLFSYNDTPHFEIAW